MNLSTASPTAPRASTPVHRRPRLLAVLAALALTTALGTGLTGTGHSSSAAFGQVAHHDMPAAVTRTVLTPAQAAFHDEMRKLWEDHVTWTRLAIVAFADGSAGFDAAATRLLRNQEDIGDAIEPYYGAAAGDALTALLTDHIGIAVELLRAVKAEDGTAVAHARTAWYANADDIADFLARANPRHWPQETMRGAMRAHLDQTLAEAAHELAGEHAASVADYDEVHHHILAMADVLSTGIIRAFPGRFR